MSALFAATSEKTIVVLMVKKKVKSKPRLQTLSIVVFYSSPQDLMVVSLLPPFPPREAKYFDNNQQPHTPSFMTPPAAPTVPPTPRRGHPQLSPAVVATAIPTTWCF